MQLALYIADDDGDHALLEYVGEAHVIGSFLNERPLNRYFVCPDGEGEVPAWANVLRVESSAGVILYRGNPQQVAYWLKALTSTVGLQVRDLTGIFNRTVLGHNLCPVQPAQAWIDANQWPTGAAFITPALIPPEEAAQIVQLV